MYNKTDRNYINYKYNDTYYRVPTFGRIYKIIDFGVSHLPNEKNPLLPKLSLIKFKEQLGCQGAIRTVYKKTYIK